MPRELENRMWKQLKGAFAVDEVRFVENDRQLLEAIMSLSDFKLIYLEPTGHKDVKDIPRDGNIALFLSNTSVNNFHFVKPEEAYRINTPKPTHLYGINAAAIALAYRIL